MTICEKIIQLYPQISFGDFNPLFGTITIQNDSDGRGDYIAKWEHPDYPRPTDEQLDAVTGVTSEIE